ncbi:MAG: hypothetical protein Q4A09_06460 [Capnocytophaga felis]|nr:hypothetical protein [Capnocytophaga felis]
MKYTIIISIAILGLFASCEKENQNAIPEIKIGQDEQSLSEVSVNKQTTRYILLSGGNEKFAVNIENSRVAQASVHQDTLKIKGLFEGETFATVISHDKKAHLKINVIPPDISISQEIVQIYPNEESKFVSIDGGGDEPTLEVDDPDGILLYKWNGNTKILEMFARYEGEAIVRISAQGVETKQLKVIVKSRGDSQTFGYYDNTRRTLSRQITPKMIVKRKGVGVWMATGVNPYGKTHTQSYTTPRVLKIASATNLVQGKHADIQVEIYPEGEQFLGISNGTNRLYVEEIREESLVLRGKGFKLVIPKE